MLQLIKDNYLEITGAVTGLLYLYFSVTQNIWLWPLGILTSGFYVAIFFSHQLYADMTLNIYYLLISMYGWHHWLIRKDNASHTSIKISVLSLSDWLVYLGVVSLLTIGFAMILIYIPQKIGMKPSAVPWWDAFLSAGSIVATWMLARKILEQWLWWIVIDTLSMGVFFFKGLYLTVFLFLANTVMAAVGYYQWKKDPDLS